MKALVWCMVLIRNVVCFELEATWPRIYDWSDDKHFLKNVVCLLKTYKTLVISVLISKTNKGVVQEWNICGTLLVSYVSRNDGCCISFWMQTLFCLTVHFFCQDTLGYLSCLFPAPPVMNTPVESIFPWLYNQVGCLFVLVSVPYVWLGSFIGMAPENNYVSFLFCFPCPWLEELFF